MLVVGRVVFASRYEGGGQGFIWRAQLAKSKRGDRTQRGREKAASYEGQLTIGSGGDEGWMYSGTVGRGCRDRATSGEDCGSLETYKHRERPSGNSEVSLAKAEAGIDRALAGPHNPTVSDRCSPSRDRSDASQHGSSHPRAPA